MRLTSSEPIPFPRHCGLTKTPASHGVSCGRESMSWATSIADHSYCEVLPCGPPTILRDTSSSIPQNGVVPALKCTQDSQPDIQFASVFRPNEKEISHGRVSWQTH